MVISFISISNPLFTNSNASHHPKPYDTSNLNHHQFLEMLVTSVISSTLPGCTRFYSMKSETDIISFRSLWHPRSPKRQKFRKLVSHHQMMMKKKLLYLQWTSKYPYLKKRENRLKHLVQHRLCCCSRFTWWQKKHPIFRFKFKIDIISKEELF